MPNLTIEKTYEDGVTPTSADFDNICDSLETFLNVTKLGADNIADNSITASSTFVAESISADKIQNLAVTTAKIVDNAVIAAKFATGAVTTAKIADANITTAKIADASVTSAKLDDGAVTLLKKPLNGFTSSGASINSSGSVVYSSANGVNASRPYIYSGGGGDFTLHSQVSGQVLDGNIILQKNGSTIMSQEFRAGPLEFTVGYSTTSVLPSSCLFLIDLTETSTDNVILIKQGVDLVVGANLASDGINSIAEII